MELRRILMCALWLFAGAASCAAGATTTGAVAGTDPAADLQAFQNYFKEQFPNVPPDDFVNGPYSMNKGIRAQRRQEAVRHPVCQWQNLRRLLCERGDWHPAKLSLLRRPTRPGGRPGDGRQPLPYGEWREAAQS